MNWLKNNYGYILLAISISLNVYFIFFKANTVVEDYRIELNEKEILNYKKTISELQCEKDSIANTKRKYIYINKNTSKQRDEKTDNYYNTDDSIRIYEGAVRSFNFKIP